ncbi:hypothetical protein UAY_03060 [Enterococcus moraviensis ATCC BAA-383]|uniref:HTH gntR-type domain-containing protein n=1 Tax=Enterococcus moraviensis ATCC BAA-383 TaxID=1158609 RepID=R2SLX5_9ENTE|nr:GntR family transcriptional regulator [Enterococcus moraviensis]EOH96150.1 hypothetical protein UAY_03060 [Enterococcus moraviensis ATCC BAA-383]EOT66122.1 hypothetical protein I586_02393 [Enterococcus moraviensis ATCC BAA-383]OJG65737.1 hypothetical protein RV09_GL001077 [Enterococcus moraviensis]
MKIPKYQQIKNDLLNKIKSGEFEHGDRFYSENELIKLYNASSITVIRAIQELASEGYLVRYQGKGTYVSRSRKRKLVEFTDIEIFAGKTETVEVISIVEESDPRIVKELNLQPDQTYRKITRIRKVDAIAFILHFTFMPNQFINHDVTELSYYDSIYERFKTEFGIHMYDEHATETNEILFPTPKKVAKLLSSTESEPVVFQMKKTTLQDGTVAEYVESYKKWDYYKIEFSTYKM